MPAVRSEGVDIAYDASAPSDAETVVFVQGWSYGRWMWERAGTFGEHRREFLTDV